MGIIEEAINGTRHKLTCDRCGKEATYFTDHDEYEDNEGLVRAAEDGWRRLARSNINLRVDMGAKFVLCGECDTEIDAVMTNR